MTIVHVCLHELHEMEHGACLSVKDTKVVWGLQVGCSRLYAFPSMNFSCDH